MTIQGYKWLTQSNRASTQILLLIMHWASISWGPNSKCNFHPVGMHKSARSLRESGFRAAKVAPICPSHMPLCSALSLKTSDQTTSSGSLFPDFHLRLTTGEPWQDVRDRKLREARVVIPGISLCHLPSNSPWYSNQGHSSSGDNFSWFL